MTFCQCEEIATPYTVQSVSVAELGREPALPCALLCRRYPRPTDPVPNGRMLPSEFGYFLHQQPLQITFSKEVTSKQSLLETEESHMLGLFGNSVNNSAVQFRTFGRLSVSVLRGYTNCCEAIDREANSLPYEREVLSPETCEESCNHRWNGRVSLPRWPALGRSGRVPLSSLLDLETSCEFGWNSQTFQSGGLRPLRRKGHHAGRSPR